MNESYRLDHQYELIRASVGEFAIHYTTYRDNIFFRQSWERRLAIFDQEDPCYWITYLSQRIGGVCFEPNSMSALFLEPPYTDLDAVLPQLKRLLLQCSDPDHPVKAYGIVPNQMESFLRLGFLPEESRRVMIRPTEYLEAQQWGAAFAVHSPSPEYIEKLAEMFVACYAGSDQIGYPGENSIEQQRLALKNHFAYQTEAILSEASSLVVDRKNGQVVAACLIALWEDLPLVSNIAVLPAYRGNGLASKLLKLALTVLYDKYEVLRLFVTIGNPAQAVYHNLGFGAGTEQTTFYLPIRS